MSQEDLILTTLLDIKQDIGGLRAEIVGIMRDKVQQDERLDSQSKKIQALASFQTAFKAQAGIVGTVTGGIISVVIWVADKAFATHRLVIK